MSICLFFINITEYGPYGSRLLSCAIEHLNAEIVQLTVSDISLAIEWLKCSYLYVRIKKACVHHHP